MASPAEALAEAVAAMEAAEAAPAAAEAAPAAAAYAGPADGSPLIEDYDSDTGLPCTTRSSGPGPSLASS